MTRRKKFIIFGTVTLSLGILAALCVAGAGSGFGGHWAHAGYFKHGCQGKAGGYFMKALVLAHVDDMADTLELSETQNEKFQDIRKQLESNIDMGRERRQAFFDSVRGEINADEPDMAGLVGMVKGKINEIPDHMSDNLDLFLSFYDILDQDQKEQLIEMFRDRLEGCES